MDKNASFGQRRSHLGASNSKGKGRAHSDVRHTADGGMELTFVPRTSASADDYDEGGAGPAGQMKGNPRRKGVEAFGAGMERGGEEPEVQLTDAERKGRTKRRQGMRSGSKNTFRRM